MDHYQHYLSSSEVTKRFSEWEERFQVVILSIAMVKLNTKVWDVLRRIFELADPIVTMSFDGEGPRYARIEDCEENKPLVLALKNFLHEAM